MSGGNLFRTWRCTDGGSRQREDAPQLFGAGGMHIVKLALLCVFLYLMTLLVADYFDP